MSITEIPDYRAIHQRLRNPVNGRHSSELDVSPKTIAERMNFDNERSIRAKEAYERKLMRDARKRRAAELAADFQITLDAWVASAENEPVAPAIPKLLFEQVIETVIKFYGIPRVAMLSRNKTTRLARPRQIAMYLGMELTELSSPQIGSRLGGRDHTTILWGAKKIRAEIETDKQLAADVACLRQILETRN